MAGKIERTNGWWWCWLKRRSQDADRQWFGRGNLRRCVSPQSEIREGHFVGSSRPPNSEDTIVALLDVQAAWGQLQPCYQRILRLVSEGYDPTEIAGILRTTRPSVDSMTYQARRRIKEACA